MGHGGIMTGDETLARRDIEEGARSSHWGDRE